MEAIDLDALKKLDKTDQEKVNYFIGLLTKKSKYKNLKEEIQKRRNEIQKGETLDHEEMWKKLGV